LTEPEAPSQAPNTTTIEFTCVGNARKNYINAQISVYWFDVKVDTQKKTVLVIHRFIPMKSYHRESRVNYCQYQIPNEVICIVMRHVQTKPDTHEYRFFKVQDGKFHSLAEGCIADFTRFFLQDYKGYSPGESLGHLSVGSPNCIDKAIVRQLDS
jgi:hypothetical protein